MLSSPDRSFLGNLVYSSFECKGIVKTEEGFTLQIKGGRNMKKQQQIKPLLKKPIFKSPSQTKKPGCGCGKKKK